MNTSRNVLESLSILQECVVVIVNSKCPCTITKSQLKEMKDNLTIVLLNCLLLFFIHSKLELPTQYATISISSSYNLLYLFFGKNMFYFLTDSLAMHYNLDKMSCRRFLFTFLYLWALVLKPRVWVGCNFGWTKLRRSLPLLVVSRLAWVTINTDQDMQMSGPKFI